MKFHLSVRWAMLALTAVAISSEFLTAQATISAAPLLLHEVKTIYIAPSSDNLVQLLRSHLQKWSAVTVTARIEEADAILSCNAESRIVAAKVVVRVIDAQVRLVDRRSQKLIWSTEKSTSWEERLADDIFDQLKKDREKSFSNY